jgi:hypothetical protein
MKKLQTRKTTAGNLEEKFARGDDVLDYFEVGKARIVVSPAQPSGAKPGSGSVSQRRPRRRVAVAETPPPYKKKR